MISKVYTYKVKAILINILNDSWSMYLVIINTLYDRADSANYSTKVKTLKDLTW